MATYKIDEIIETLNKSVYTFCTAEGMTEIF
jgi:hypothetical protein